MVELHRKVVRVAAAAGSVRNRTQDQRWHIQPINMEIEWGYLGIRDFMGISNH